MTVGYDSHRCVVLGRDLTFDVNKLGICLHVARPLDAHGGWLWWMCSKSGMEVRSPPTSCNNDSSFRVRMFGLEFHKSRRHPCQEMQLGHIKTRNVPSRPLIVTQARHCHLAQECDLERKLKHTRSKTEASEMHNYERGLGGCPLGEFGHVLLRSKITFYCVEQGVCYGSYITGRATGGATGRATGGATGHTLRETVRVAFSYL